MSSKHTGFLALLLLLLPPPTQASTVLGLTRAELLAESELIFHGEVVASQAREDAAGRITTHLTFLVNDVFKGDYAADVLELEFLGGILDGRITQVGGLRIPPLGEAGTFYVESLSGSLVNPLLGWSPEHVVQAVQPVPVPSGRQYALRLEGESDAAAAGFAGSSAYRLSGNRWSTGTAQIYIGMPGTAPGGVTWGQSLRSALDQWNSQTAFQFQAVEQYQDPCQGGGQGKGHVSVGFAATACGQEFGSKVLALTMLTGTCFASDCKSGVAIDNASVIFNSNEPWDVYTGPRRVGSNDFGRVALHELGHVLGLGHESVRGAIMQANVTDLFALQADDINAANAIYGPAVARDDQYTNVLPSIYGINVILPPRSERGGAPQNFTLTGALDSRDGLLNGRHIDLFQYTLGQDTQVDVRMESSEVDARLYLVRMDSMQRPIPGETFIDDNGGGNLDARLQRTLAAGTYWIGASTALPGRRGSYSLNISTGLTAPATFDSYVSKHGISVQINPNPFISGALDTGDATYAGKPIDLYEFTVNDTVTLQIDLGSTAFDTLLYLARVLQNQDLDRTMFFQDDDGGGSGNSRLVQTLLPGTYWIGASSAAADASGGYQLSISVRP